MDTSKRERYLRGLARRFEPLLLVDRVVQVPTARREDQERKRQKKERTEFELYKGM